MGHWGWTLVTFTVIVSFIDCLGWTFVACTAFVVEAFGLVAFVAFRVFVAFLIHWGWDPCGVYKVSSVYEEALRLNVLCRLQRLYYLWSVLVGRLWRL